MNQVMHWIMVMVSKLKPRQSTSGNSTVQVEKAGGDVQIDNSQSQVTMHVTQNFYSAQVQAQPAANGMATPEQREVLRMLSRMPNRGESVFRFMETNFNTRMVIDLRPGELKRVQAYIASINRRLAARPTQGGACNESA